MKKKTRLAYIQVEIKNIDGIGDCVVSPHGNGILFSLDEMRTRKHPDVYLYKFINGRYELIRIR